MCVRDWFNLPVKELVGQEDPWRRKRQPTPVFLPGESHRQRSLAGYSPWGHKVLDMTEWLTNKGTGEQQGSLVCCVHGVTNSWTRLSDWTTQRELADGKAVPKTIWRTEIYKVTQEGHLFLNRKAMINLESVKKQRHTFPTNVHIVKAWSFQVIMYRCESWTI